MAHSNNCLSCGTSFVGNRGRQFCGDSCRKYHQRHNGKSKSGLPNTQLVTSKKSGQKRTSTGSSMANYAGKALIDLAGKVAERQLLPSQTSYKQLGSSPSLHNIPLVTATLANVTDEKRPDGHYRPVLSPTLQAFLGELTYPFQALIWGLPGSGKSTFSMRMANALAERFQVLYISGEEDLKSATLKQKQERTITRGNHFLFANRMPSSTSEWQQTLYPPTIGSHPAQISSQGMQLAGSQTVLPSGRAIQSLTSFPTGYLAYRTIVYDSITMMGIHPFDVKATANDCELPAYSEKLGHIFISHAHKDGKEYRGDGSWGHEVDIIIRCHEGMAEIRKNRFATAEHGRIGSTIKIY